jgi:hypothetical protein
MLPPTEVRYWSFDVNSTLLTNVTACLADHQATVAEDGFVYLALGREVPEILKKVKAFGLNFLPWGAHEEILLVYRQILANFASSARAVPVFDPTHYRETQSAYCSFKMNTDPALDLDVDYAPVGAYYSETDFLDNFSGFELPDIVCAPILVD